MKVVDIHTGRNKIVQQLATFRESHKFEDFLSAVEYCLKNNVQDCSELEAEWEASQQNILFDNGMECFSKLLAKIKIEYLPLERQVIAETEEENAISTELCRRLVEGFDDISEKRKQCSDKYSWFYPSFMVSKLLPGVYPEDLDPGQIIAKYLKQLFPETPPDVFSDSGRYKDSKIYPLLFSSEFHTFFKAISKTIIFSAYPDEIIHKSIFRGFCDIIDPENREHRNQFSEQMLIDFFIRIIMSLPPKEFFYAWHDAMIEQLHDFDTDDEFRTSFSRTALNMISFGKDNLSVMGEDYKVNSSDSTEEFTDNMSFWEHAASEKYLSFDDMFEWFYIYFMIAMNTDEELKPVAVRLTSNLTVHRQKYFAGIFPASTISCGSIAGELVGLIGIENSDLLVMLREGDFESILCLFPSDREQSYQQRINQLEKAQSYYITLFNKSLEEGFPELAVSLISVYILLRTVIEKGRFGNFPELMPVIERALSLPGAKTLKHTLAFVVDSVGTYFSNDQIAVCSASYFRQYLTKPAELHVIEGTAKSPFRRVNNEAEIKAFFENELGSERWEKLSENSRSCLVSAELQWRNSAVEFGFGIKDWSGLITTYCKAIEGELVERLAEFYASNEYEAHLTGKGLKRPAKATAGWLLKELRGYESMPPQLQAILQKSRIRLAGEKDIVNRLYDIVQNYRNISAHHNAVSMKHYAEFKEKLFQSGLLSKFIDAFVE